MTPKQQLKAIRLLERFVKYAEDWQKETAAKPYYLPNGVALRQEVKDFLDNVEAEEEKPTKKDKE